MALRDQPYLPLYVQDFLTDEKLMLCSASATGFYIRLLCIMHKSETYGKIKLDNKFKTFQEMLAVFMPWDIKVVSECLQELLDSNILLIKSGFLIQKRMANDGELSIKRAESGRVGGTISRFNKTAYSNKQNGSKTSSKTEANTENEYEYEYVNENNKEDNIIYNKKKKISDAPHSQAIEYFCKKYEEKVGSKYVFAGGKDGAHIKAMLKFLTLDQFKYKVNAFFFSGDEFVKKAGYTVGVLRSQINKIKGDKYEAGIERFIKND